MTASASSYVPRPPMAFRVGVTGARKLPPHELDRIRAHIHDVLAFVRDEVIDLSSCDAAIKIYAPASEGAHPLRLVSPLAEGADRRVAEIAYDLKYALYAPLPFPQATYEQDFPETLAVFRDRLGKSEKFELDGEPGNFASDSYREVGRFAVRNCDLLIALWDGEREHGPGGTAEIVRYAVATNVPVWRIDPRGRVEPGFIERPSELRADEAAEKDAKGRLKSYLQRTLLPPEAAHASHHGFFAGVAHLCAKCVGRRSAPLDEFFAERAPSRGFVWRAYSVMTWLLSPRAPREVPALKSATNDVESWWETRYRAADALAIGQGDRYRSSYVWIALFAFVALAAAALSFVLPHEAEPFLIGGEVFALLVISFIVTASHLRRWHEKWISYRLLAELFRKQYVLASIGRSLPAAEASRAAQSSDAPHDAWVAWWFAAAQRAAPFPRGSIRDSMAGALELASSLVEEQAAYHENCETRYKAAARKLEVLGEIFFLSAAVLTAAKVGAFLLHDKTLLGWTGALAICVSAASASFVGLRAYSEFALLARQSKHMCDAMKQARLDLEDIDTKAPLAARDLGRTLYTLALLMLQDVGGWARLFRMKTLEAA